MIGALTRRRVRWGLVGTVKTTADGNSITIGGQDGAESADGVIGYVHRHIAPFSLQTEQNVAIGGINTQDMIDSHADVDGAFDSGRINVLFAQEGTNQNSVGDSGAVNCQKFLDYVSARREARGWFAIALATAPPCYLGDQVAQSATTTWNLRLDDYNAELRQRWKEVADCLIETRQPGSPYAQSRYPDYLKARFYDETVINGISNEASYITEPSSGPVPFQKIHYSAAGIAKLAPFVADGLLRMTARARA